MEKFKKISKLISVGIIAAVISNVPVNAAVADTGFDDVSADA